MVPGPNALPAASLSAPERLQELGEILALGIIRLRQETLAGNDPHRGEELVDSSAAESGRATRRENAGKRR